MDQEAVSLTDFAAVAPAPSAAVDAPPADDVSVVAWQLQELEPPDMSTRQLLAMVVSTMANHCVAGVDEIQDTVQRMIRRATSAQRRTVNLDIDFGCELMREASGQVLWIFHLHLEIYHAGLRKCRHGRSSCLPVPASSVSDERGSTAHLRPASLRPHLRRTHQPPLAPGSGESTIQDGRAHAGLKRENNLD